MNRESSHAMTHTHPQTNNGRRRRETIGALTLLFVSSCYDEDAFQITVNCITSAFLLEHYTDNMGLSSATTAQAPFITSARSLKNNKNAVEKFWMPWAPCWVYHPWQKQI